MEGGLAVAALRGVRVLPPSARRWAPARLPTPTPPNLASLYPRLDWASAPLGRSSVEGDVGAGLLGGGGGQDTGAAPAGAGTTKRPPRTSSVSRP